MAVGSVSATFAGIYGLVRDETTVNVTGQEWPSPAIEGTVPTPPLRLEKGEEVDLAMTVVAIDGQYTRPVEVDERRIAVAERYDVIVGPKVARAYTIVAQAIDRIGCARAVLLSGRYAGHRLRIETFSEAGDTVAPRRG